MMLFATATGRRCHRGQAFTRVMQMRSHLEILDVNLLLHYD